jgi:hypothetical protein
MILSVLVKHESTAVELKLWTAKWMVELISKMVITHLDVYNLSVLKFELAHLKDSFCFHILHIAKQSPSTGVKEFRNSLDF